MSIFASQTAETIPVPFDPSQMVTIRKLTGREVDAAQAEHLRNLVAGKPARGWASTFQRVLQKGVAATDAETLQAVRDPLNGFDRYAVVKAGLVGWTYGEKTDQTIEDLDDEAVDWLATEILKRTKPGLFLTPDEQAADRKNG